MSRSIGRVLVTGAGGQLGLDVLDAFRAQDVEVVGLTHGNLDVADRDAVFAAVEQHRPDTVVHCAAWTNVDGCEKDPDKAHRVNARGSGWLAEAADGIGATILAISTDYVFDGTLDGDPSSARAWTEDDPIAPASQYGRSKAEGERLVREATDRHHVVRTAWVCGARGHNFAKTMLRVGREQGAAKVVDDQWGTPTFTRDLARALVDLAQSEQYGTWHRTNAGRTNWHDFAAAVFEDAGLEVDLSRMSSDELDRPAPRPAWSVLSNDRAERAGLLHMPGWRESLRDLLSELGSLRADLEEARTSTSGASA